MKIFSLLLAVGVFAKEITGIGVGDTFDKSKKEALRDLASNISVDIKSSFVNYKKLYKDNFINIKEQSINLSTNLPIKGVRYKKLIDGIRLTKTQAILSNKSLKVYLEELNSIYQNIQDLKDLLNKTKDKEEKYTILQDLLKNIQEFDKYKVVAITLGAKNIKKLPISKSEVILLLRKIEKKAPSIEILADILSRDIDCKNIYIEPIKNNSSYEVTQFANILKSYLQKNLVTAINSNYASCYLKGNYNILKDSLFVTINLLDKNNKIILTKTAQISKSALDGIEYKPKNNKFDKIANLGVLKDKDFYVKVWFRGFYNVSGLDFHKGDSLDIMVKTNKNMCYYLIGHVLRDKEKFSYLLPIGDGSGKWEFIRKIENEDVNRNILVASDVPIEEPFGRESLQIVAQTLKNGRCELEIPKCRFIDDYCVINSPEKTIKLVARALKIKRNKKVENATNIIYWNSFK